MFTAYKSVKQSYSPSPDIVEMLEIFSKMVNDCIRIGLQNNISTMKRLCQLSYKKTGKYHIVNYYRLCAISKAAGILANRKKSIMRGHSTKEPYQNKPILISCYGFKLQNGILKIPLGNRQYFDIQLNDYVRSILSSDLTAKIRSFTLTPTTISICYARKVKEIKYSTTIGIDRNLKNLTVGNRQNITQYNLSKVVQITEDTRSVVRSFKRNDVRIRKKIATKYGQRRRNRINQLLHKVSKIVVQQAKQDKTALVFEDIRRIRGLYLRGNGQGRDHRAKMNSWPFHELKYQIEYKAVWEGVSVIQLSKGETRGTSKLCPQCGKRTQEATYGDREHYRQL